MTIVRWLLLSAGLMSAVLVSAVACQDAPPPVPAAPTPEATTPPPIPAVTATTARAVPAAATSHATHVPTMSPTQMPLINVADMMGYFPQQTVFVATRDHISAVTLLNHFTRYRIPTNGVAQVTASRTEQRLYVLEAHQPGSHLLRAFDVASGDQLAAQGGISDVTADQRALAVSADGRVLVLKSDATRTWVDAYDADNLQPLGSVMDTAGCGDRLLASVHRLAIVCLSTGEILLDDLGGNRARVPGAPHDLVAATMSIEGALCVATADRELSRVRARTTILDSVSWPEDWPGTVLADGLAFSTEQAALVIVQASDEAGWVRVLPSTTMGRPASFRLAGVPHGGIQELFPFAYYTVANTVRHVDLTSGLLETMTEVGDDAVPVAVVNG